MNGEFQFLKELPKLITNERFTALMAISFFLMFIGVIPSPILQNNLLLKANQEIMLDHQSEQKTSSEKQIRLSLAKCVNDALAENDQLGAQICVLSLTNDKDTQLKMIEKVIERAKKHDQNS